MYVYEGRSAFSAEVRAQLVGATSDHDLDRVVNSAMRWATSQQIVGEGMATTPVDYAQGVSCA